MVPLLKPPSFEFSKLRGENPVHGNQTTRLEQCAARTRVLLLRCSAGCRFTLRASGVSSWHDFAWPSSVKVINTRFRTQWHD